MAPRRHTPTVRLRRLAAELRRLRAAADMSRDGASEQTGINHATLYRIETGKARPQMRTLVALLNLYGVDTEQREYLTNLCRDAAQQGWLRPYSTELTDEYAAYISFEDEARSVRNYDSLLIPGLLQTADYIHAVISGTLLSPDEDAVAGRVKARLQRQRVLTREDPLKLWVIVDEAALRRVVGGADVMRRQLLHLTEAAKAPNITIQVIPFGTGAHPGMVGSVVLMDFSDPLDTDLVYLESMVGSLFLESDAEVRRYTSVFDTLRAIALSPDDSASLIADVAHQTGR